MNINFEMTEDQVDLILTTELKAALEMNITDFPGHRTDWQLVDALIRVLEYCTPKSEFDEYIKNLNYKRETTAED